MLPAGGMVNSTVLGERSELLGNWNMRLARLGRSRLINFQDLECQGEEFLLGHPEVSYCL